MVMYRRKLIVMKSNFLTLYTVKFYSIYDNISVLLPSRVEKLPFEVLAHIFKST
jgi:hypothetical protein